MTDWAEVVNWTVGVALGLSTLLTLFLFTAPSQYDPFAQSKDEGQQAGEIGEDEKSRNQTRDRSSRPAQPPQTLQVVVLGDIGRSPRMQYHAISFAKHGGKVDLIGFRESELHPKVSSNPNITVVPLVPIPPSFHASNKILFLFTAPLKVLWQVWSLYHTLGYRTQPARWMLVQNPPSIPTLAIAQWICFFRCTRLVIDWHNFGYSILGLKLGSQHPLVRLSQWYEGYFCQNADAHFTVTNAMARVLQATFNIKATTLHDRPASEFQSLSDDRKKAVLERLTETKEHAADLQSGRWKLIVSSTSWTADEDFSLLLEALQAYSAACVQQMNMPNILAIITGKGPQKELYLNRIQSLNQENRLRNVLIATAWLSTEDYASLLGAADIGISLHTSSSGVDLPMKVVDMFGAGLPVLGWGKFEAWPELVREGFNGRGFGSADELTKLLKEVLGGDGAQLRLLREGALKEGAIRWDDEWDEVAAKLFCLKADRRP